jgi:hypothetical protein
MSSSTQTVVPLVDWPSALAQLNGAHHGEHVTVELLDGPHLPTTLVADASLRSIVPDGRDAVFVTFVPDLASGRDATPVSIVGPTVLVLRRAHDGTDRGVELQTRQGRRYRLQFRGSPPDVR